MADGDILHDKIVNRALERAERHSWEAVRLHDVATDLGVTLNDVRHHFRDKEALVDAWFDRADAAMLQATEAPDFAQLPARHRLHRLIMAWLDALSPHRKATREMIYGKFEFGHIHIQVPGLMRVSRTVQWVREAARRDATFMRRALEETGLTAIYLMTFFHWMQDTSERTERTRRFLDDKLAMAERLDQCVQRACRCRTASAAPMQAAPATQPGGQTEEPTL